MESWVGFYEYGGEKFEMTFENVDFNPITGEFRASGSDSSGEFTYTGTIFGTNFKAIKDYTAWVIHYSGKYYAEKSEISGFWGYEPQTDFSPFVIARIPSSKVDIFRSNLANNLDPFSNFS